MRRFIRALSFVALATPFTFLLAWAAPATPRPPKSAADTLHVHLGPAEGGTDAFVAMPAGTAPAPAVIVVQQWWGLDGQIRDVARKLAREGYVAIVPDLYHGKVAGDPEFAHELSRGLREESAMADLDAAASWLKAQSRTAKTKIGVMGFCMGGGLTLKFGLHSAVPSALVMCYGPPIVDATQLAKLRAPLLGHFGATDRGITVADVEAFEAALKKAGRTATLHEYPGAGHAFMDDTRPAFHADAAAQAWARTLVFFQKYLRS